MNNVFKSGAQVVVNRNAFYPTVPGEDKDRNKKSTLNHVALVSDREFKRILRHPTVNLASRVVTAMLLSQPWIMEGDDDDWCNYAYSNIEPYRTMLVRSAMRGILMQGWRVLELAYDTIEDAPIIGGTQNTLVGMKALRNGLTQPLIYEDTGEFAGVYSTDAKGNTVSIDTDHLIFVNADEDYIGSLGEPQLRDVQETFRKWEKCDKVAQRYDEKVAGGMLAIGYPQGNFDVDQGDGSTEKTNAADVAKIMADGAKGSGYLLYPRKPDPETGEYKDGDWKLEHIMSSGSGLQPNFIAREKYLDALMLRVFGIPERAVTEGSFGTKAEAEAHSAIAFLTNLDRSEFIMHGTNEGFVKPFNRACVGDEKACRLKLGDMTEANIALFGSIFTQMLKDPNSAVETYARVDIEQLMDKAGVPALSAEEQKKRQAELEAKKKEEADAAFAQQQQIAKPPAEGGVK